MSKMGLAFMAGMERTSEKSPGGTPETPVPTGNWSRAAMREIDQKLDDMRAMTTQGLLEGRLPIRVSAASIEDPLGSDRVLAGPQEDADDDSEGFRALVENIRHRGLRSPLRVRPADPAWRPDPAAPQRVDGVSFILQSGRRRLAACRELGIDPLVFLSFVEAKDAPLEDLRERFFENAIRRQLAPFEKLLSIGMIAEATPGTTQDQIAEIVGIPQTAVSRGLAVLRHREALIERLPSPATASLRDIQAVLSELHADELSETPDAVRKRASRERDRVALPFQRVDCNNTRIELRKVRGGRLALSLTTGDLSVDDLNRIVDDVRDMISRRQQPDDIQPE